MDLRCTNLGHKFDASSTNWSHLAVIRGDVCSFGAVSTYTLINGNDGYVDDSKQHAESVLKVVANYHHLFSYHRKSAGCILWVIHFSSSKYFQKCFQLIQFRLS